MEIKRGYKNGRFDEANTLKYSNIGIRNVVEMLEDFKKRAEQGIKHIGTEIVAVKVNSWTEIINKPSDFDKMIKEYKQYC